MKTTLAPTPPAVPSQFTLDEPPRSTPAPRLFGVLPPATTPRLLRLALVLISLGAFALFASSTSALRQSRAGLQSVGKDCAPSIIAAQRIRGALADLDANLLNQFIVAPGSTDMENAVNTVAQRRREIGENLVRAAENITFGDAERVPITTLVQQLGTYEALLARAYGLHEKGDLEAALRVEREGERLLHQTLIPAADELDRVNTAVLENAFSSVHAANSRQVALVIFTGTMLTALLVITQLWLARRTRRLINPALLLGTILAVGFTGWTAAALLRSSEFLRAATKDAFASIHWLWQTRAVSYDGNAAESRWLLDRSAAPAESAERLFHESAARIARLPDGMTFPQLVDTFRAMPDPLRPVPGFDGFLAQELGNITFVDEREAATEMLRTWGFYHGLDAEIRRLEHTGDHHAAVAFCLSYAPDGSNGAFDAFHKALSKTLDINERAFAAALEHGFTSLKGLDPIAPIAALLIAGCTLAGLLPRLREYRA